MDAQPAITTTNFPAAPSYALPAPFPCPALYTIGIVFSIPYSSPYQVSPLDVQLGDRAGLRPSGVSKGYCSVTQPCCVAI